MKFPAIVDGQVSKGAEVWTEGVASMGSGTRVFGGINGLASSVFIVPSAWAGSLEGASG